MLARNMERYAERIAALEAAGSDVLVVWKCETKDVGPLRDRLHRFLT